MLLCPSLQRELLISLCCDCLKFFPVCSISFTLNDVLSMQNALVTSVGLIAVTSRLAFVSVRPTSWEVAVINVL